VNFSSELKPQQDFKYPLWQKPYLEALIAPDTSTLQQAIAAAEAAILARLELISQNIEQHRAERVAIEDALTSLRVLKKETQGPAAGIGCVAEQAQ
jgi:hypothetical protein